MKDNFLKILIGMLIFGGGALLHYLGNNPRILYLPAVALCLWVSWIILSGVHTYVSSEETLLNEKAVSLPSTVHVPAHAPASEEKPESVKLFQQIAAVTTTHQPNTHTGVVNVSGPQPRILSDDQKAMITDTLRSFAAEKNFNMFGTSADSESTQFSKQLIDCVEASGLKPKSMLLGQAFLTDPVEGVQIVVRDGNNPPPLAKALWDVLQKASVVVSAAQNPDWGEEDKDRVDLNVYPNPASSPH